MIVSLTLFGRQFFTLEVGRRFRVVPEGSTLVHLGTLTELSQDDLEEDEESEEGHLSFGFS